MPNNSTNALEIPITISTEFTFESKAEQKTMAVDAISHHLEAVFYFMKMAVRGHDILDLCADNKLLDFTDLRCHLHSMCQIGEALASELTRYSYHPTEPTSNTETVTIIDNSQKDAARSESPAQMLSRILNDKTMPEPLREAIRTGLTDLFNEHVDQTPFIEREQSPEYIQMLLDNYSDPEAKR